MIKAFRRIFLTVLDSFGIGELPDAADFSDVGSNSYRSVCTSAMLNIPTLRSLGLDRINIVSRSDAAVKGAYGSMAEQSRGKDTTVGHWEIAGVISHEALPVFPNGFPDELMNEFSRLVGRGWIEGANKPYSGTQVIKDFGREHCETGKLIVYTSADSVFQIAAHEQIVPLDELYSICLTARKLLKGKYGVGRVIARPFLGTAPDYYRTANRHDYSLEVPGVTMLDLLKKAGLDVISVGKINDIFALRGITEAIAAKNNREGMAALDKLIDRDFCGLCFTNLVDFDMLYGHRNNVDGYAAALSEFDAFLARFIEKMRPDDLLIITADHGCDPLTPSTDHSREYTPLLVYFDGIVPTDLKTRTTFADTAATVCEAFGVDAPCCGTSYLREITK